MWRAGRVTSAVSEETVHMNDRSHRLLVRPLAYQRQQDSLAKQAAADADAKADEDELQKWGRQSSSAPVPPAAPAK